MVQIKLVGFLAAAALITTVFAAPIAEHTTPGLAARELQAYKRALAFDNDFIELERRYTNPDLKICRKRCRDTIKGLALIKCFMSCKRRYRVKKVKNVPKRPGFVIDGPSRY